MFKRGDIVTGQVLFGEELVRGTIVAEDADISRDAVIVELSDGSHHVMLESSIERKLDK